MTQFASVAFAALFVLLVSRLSSLKRAAARPAWLATFFGCLAIISIGAVFPITVVDGVLGGTNLINLVQSFLTVSAFWFFRDAVTIFYQNPRRNSPWWLLFAVVLMSMPFAFIVNRGGTSSSFMEDHVDQLGNVLYNTVYMLTVAAVVIDLMILLRRPSDKTQRLFLIGLAPIPLACIVEIIYVVTAHLDPGWEGARFFDIAFYPLFYIGVLIVAIAWTSTLIHERDTISRILWKLRSAHVAFLLKRSLRSAYKAFRSKKPDELAYALSIQIRNHEIHSQTVLNQRQERAVMRLEARFLGLNPGELTATAS